MGKSRFLMVTPMKKEFHAARESFRSAELPFDKRFRVAEIKTGSAVLHILQCGYLVEEALDQYLNAFGVPDMMIDSGSCGALCSEYRIGEIFRVTEVKKQGEETLFFDSSDRLKGLSEAVMTEVPHGIMDEENRSRLAEEASLCSMETYRICRTAEDWGCLCYSVRVVTDFADASMQKDFKQNLRPSCILLYKYLKEFLLFISH